MQDAMARSSRRFFTREPRGPAGRLGIFTPGGNANSLSETTTSRCLMIDLPYLVYRIWTGKYENVTYDGLREENASSEASVPSLAAAANA